ncbi:MAG: MATE family efflux transporter, partial [Planctomycetota bacterium]
FAMGTAAATLAGQYIGARRPDLAKRAVLVCTGIAASIMTFLGIVMIVFPHAITRSFSEQPTHIEQVPNLLIICGVIQLPFAVGICLRSAMRGAGDVHAIMVITWITTYAVRLPFAYVASGVDITLPQWLGGSTITNPVPWEPSLAGLWIGMCSELIIRSLLFTAYFMRGRWLKAKV